MTNNKLQETTERIKADAHSYLDKLGRNLLSRSSQVDIYNAHIAGATVENERAQQKDKVFEDTMQRILNVASWSDDPYKSTLLRIVSNAQEQWKDGKTGTDPCPHCGKELSRDRNLYCRECGKEVEREAT